MRIVVTGSRKLKNRMIVWAMLHEEYLAWLPHRAQGEMFIVTHGAAEGTDTFADEWARLGQAYVVPDPVEANWELLGSDAGAERNGRMIAKEPDKVLAFPIGISKGTRDCIQRAEDARIPVRKIMVKLNAPEMTREQGKQMMKMMVFKDGTCEYCGKPNNEHEKGGKLGGLEIVICDKAPNIFS